VATRWGFLSIDFNWGQIPINFQPVASDRRKQIGWCISRNLNFDTLLCITLKYVFIQQREKVMATTVNFTGAVDRELLKRAKVIAAKSDTSINALFNAELRYLVETFEVAEAGGNQNFKTLLDFSLGRLDDLTVMDALGIDSQEDLFLLMAQAHLPMPRIPEAATQAMVDSLNALVK